LGKEKTNPIAPMRFLLLNALSRHTLQSGKVETNVLVDFVVQVHPAPFALVASVCFSRAAISTAIFLLGVSAFA
jgi:hypothetical protein